MLHTSDQKKEHSSTPTLIKKMSSLVLESTLVADGIIPSHVISHAKKRIKETGSKNRNEKKWVYKDLEIHPDQLEYMRTHGGIDPLHNTAYELYLDAVISEFINISSNSRYKARVVSDDQHKKVLGKLCTFIPDLKVFGVPFTKAQDEASAENKGGPFFEELRSIKVLQSYIAFFKEKSPNYDNTLRSLARACVYLHRYDIQDLHANNIGMDESGEIILFDVEHAFTTKIGRKSDSWKPIAFHDIHKQPNRYLARLFAESYDVKRIEQLKTMIGDDKYNIYVREVYRTLLKQLLFPLSLIRSITENNKLDSEDTSHFADEIFKLMYETSNALRESLLSTKTFREYLMKESSQDIAGLIQEYEETKGYHRTYFKDDYLSKFFIIEVYELYLRLIKQVQDREIYCYIREIVEQPVTDHNALNNLLNELKLSIENYGKTKIEENKNARDSFLRQSSKLFLQIVKLADFKVKDKHIDFLIKTIMNTPVFAYRLVLAAFYTNNDAALKILLPRFLAIKKYLENKPWHDINAVDQFGKTLLFYAAETSRFEAFTYLISQNARVDMQAGVGRPLLLEIAWSEENSRLMMYLYFNRRQQTEVMLQSIYCGRSLTEWLEMQKSAIECCTHFIKTQPEAHVTSTDEYLDVMRPAFFIESIKPLRLCSNLVTNTQKSDSSLENKKVPQFEYPATYTDHNFFTPRTPTNKPAIVPILKKEALSKESHNTNTPHFRRPGT